MQTRRRYPAGTLYYKFLVDVASLRSVVTPRGKPCFSDDTKPARSRFRMTQAPLLESCQAMFALADRSPSWLPSRAVGLQYGAGLLPQALSAGSPKPLRATDCTGHCFRTGLACVALELVADETPRAVDDPCSTFLSEFLSVWQLVRRELRVDGVGPYPLPGFLRPFLAMADGLVHRTRDGGLVALGGIRVQRNAPVLEVLPGFRKPIHLLGRARARCALAGLSGVCQSFREAGKPRSRSPAHCSHTIGFATPSAPSANPFPKTASSASASVHPRRMQTLIAFSLLLAYFFRSACSLACIFSKALWLVSGKSLRLVTWEAPARLHMRIAIWCFRDLALLPRTAEKRGRSLSG